MIVRTLFFIFAFQIFLVSCGSEEKGKQPGQVSESKPSISKAQKEFDIQLSKAQAGIAEAQFKVCEAYEDGIGVEKDLQAAFEWCKKAADQGYSDAEQRLAVFYYYGNGTEKDVYKTVDYLNKAASKSNSLAMENLGFLYIRGEGVEKDIKQAAAWFEKAAAKDDISANLRLRNIYLGEYDKSLTNPQKAQELFNRALSIASSLGKEVSKGKADDFLFIGYIYLRGIGIERNPKKAIEWIKKSAEAGSVIGRYYWGWITLTGFEGISENQSSAIDIFKGLAIKDQDNGTDRSIQLDSIQLLGMIHSSGTYVPKNDSEAVTWFKKGAALGDARAQFRMSLAHYTGVGVPSDIVLAYAYSNLSATGVSRGESYSVNLDDLNPLVDKAAADAAASYSSDSEAVDLSPKKIRNYLQKKLTSAEIEEAQKIASNWKVGQALSRLAKSTNDQSNASKDDSELKLISTGTGFLVSQAGHVITNHHVVSDCQAINLQSHTASSGKLNLVSSDKTNDLALLAMTGKVGDVASISSDPEEVRQGDEVYVFGYPLSSVLSSGGNLTPGLVSALTGLNNNTNQIQITAPIQPGSSGSPVMDSKGRVIAVVSNKLSDLKTVEATKSLPQNVNFAISGQTLVAFMKANQVDFAEKSGLFSFGKDPADIAEDARRWTAIVECWG